jgi:hypothetical protein
MAVLADTIRTGTTDEALAAPGTITRRRMCARTGGRTGIQRGTVLVAPCPTGRLSDRSADSDETGLGYAVRGHDPAGVQVGNQMRW